MEVIAGHKDACPFPGSHRHLPMQSQMALVLLAIMLVFAILASLLNSWITTKNFEDNINQKAARTIQIVFNEYSQYEGLKNTAFFNKQLDDIIKDKDIAAIGLFDRQQKAILIKGKDIDVKELAAVKRHDDIRIPDIVNNTRYYVYYFPENYVTNSKTRPDSNQVAMIALTINDAIVFRTAQRAFVGTLVVSIIMAVTILMLLMVVIRKFSMPFNRLSKAMVSTQLGQRGVRVKPCGASEIYQMTESFNAMIAVIERREENLLDQKKVLEEQIELIEKTELEYKNISYRLQTIFDNVSDGILLVDNEFNIVSVNNSANRILSYFNDELIGKPLNAVMKVVFLKIAIKALAGSDKCNKLSNYETISYANCGRHIPVEVGLSSLDVSGSEHYLITFRDITERKKTEKELNEYRIHLESMVAEQTRDIARSRDAARAGERAMSAFLANMSHELRTPLHGILSFASLALKKFDTAPAEKTRYFLNEIKLSGNNLLDIINDLLDLSKMKSGKMEYHYTSGQLGKIVYDVVSQILLLAEEKNITINVSDRTQHGSIDLDESRMSQVIRNLFANAIKFAEPGTEIKVDIDCIQGEKVVFSIFNSGVSIPEGEELLIFNNFEQSSNTKTNAGGTGLGLPICKEIIESGHKGRIFVETNRTDGAKFIFEIPVNNAKLIDSDQYKEVRHG